jgi:hypothetical protein
LEFAICLLMNFPSPHPDSSLPHRARWV